MTQKFKDFLSTFLLCAALFILFSSAAAGDEPTTATPCGSGKSGVLSSIFDLVKVAFLVQSLIQSIPIKFHYHS